MRVGAILVRIEETQQQRLDEGVLIWRKFPANLIKPRDMMLRAGFPIRTIPHHSSDWTYEEARHYVAYRDALERQTFERTEKDSIPVRSKQSGSRKQG